MTSKKARTRSIVYAADALRELDEIWNRNEKAYGRDHAAKYIEFLGQHIETLGTGSYKGQAVSTRPELHYLPIL